VVKEAMTIQLHQETQEQQTLEKVVLEQVFLHQLLVALVRLVDQE
tara:strand:+ start:438 stop:572 length:135 start_codon:yes stop_codon:yes gene_type:complete